MKKSDRHQLSAVIYHFLYRTYELPLSWYGMTVPGLSQADITCLHGTCRTVLFAADRLIVQIFPVISNQKDALALLQ